MVRDKITRKAEEILWWREEEFLIFVSISHGAAQISPAILENWHLVSSASTMTSFW